MSTPAPAPFRPKRAPTQFRGPTAWPKEAAPPVEPAPAPAEAVQKPRGKRKKKPAAAISAPPAELASALDAIMADDVLTVVTFLWKPPRGYRSKFDGSHVDTLRRMVRRHYRRPHRFVCITDDPTGITEPDIELFALWDDFKDVRNPSGSKNPSCYRRLRLFAGNTGQWLGPRFVCLDLDCVIVGDMAPVWDRPEPFVIWKSTTPGNFYNGSMFMMEAGARPMVWTDFDPVLSPRETYGARLYGSDQAWIAYRLGGGEATWSAADGVYSMRNELKPQRGRLPAGARIVFFHGKGDPWSPEMQQLPWVRANYK